MTKFLAKLDANSLLNSLSLNNATLREFDVHKPAYCCRVNSVRLLLIGKDTPKGPP